jgi:hypothetical protein
MKYLFLLFVGFHFAVAAQPSPEVAFIIREPDLIPEGITYDPLDKNFFVGSINKSKVVKISTKGTVTDFIKPGQDGVLQVLGMTVDGERRLWLCNNSPEHDTTKRTANIHVYDVRTGALLKRYQLEGTEKHLFNDLIISSSGDAFITDSDGGSIYRIRKESDALEVFLKPRSIVYPNGITMTPDQKSLLVATGSEHGIVRVDIDTKKITPVRNTRFLIIGIDGLYLHNNSLIAVQNVTFPEGILQITPATDFSSIEKVAALALNEPEFDVPTTGVVVGKHFYFIANTHLFQLMGNNGVIKDRNALRNVAIMRVRLN